MREEVVGGDGVRNYHGRAKTRWVAPPPRVLADPLVTTKIKLLNDSALTKQLADITAKLPPASDAVNALIAARLKSWPTEELGRGTPLCLLKCTQTVHC